MQKIKLQIGNEYKRPADLNSVQPNIDNTILTAIFAKNKIAVFLWFIKRYLEIIIFILNKLLSRKAILNINTDKFITPAEFVKSESMLYENLYNKIENIESIKTDIASQARVSFLFEKLAFNIIIIGIIIKII